MSIFLTSAISFARHNIPRIVPEHAAGELTRADQPHKFSALYRQLGVSRMLMEGVADPMFVGLMQGAGAYSYGLTHLAQEDKVTSRAGAFWDAVGGDYWDAAVQIARHSRLTHNPTWEHEDDFLFVAFVMTRYFLKPDGDDPKELQDHAQRQRDMLERWLVVLEGAADPGLDLCEALLAADANGFNSALGVLADNRATELSEPSVLEELGAEAAAWYVPFWGKGLALLRLAESDGLETDEDVSMVPAIARVPSPFVYNPGAWRNVDVTPRRRP